MPTLRVTQSFSFCRLENIKENNLWRMSIWDILSLTTYQWYDRRHHVYVPLFLFGSRSPSDRNIINWKGMQIHQSNLVESILAPRRRLLVFIRLLLSEDFLCIYFFGNQYIELWWYTLVAPNLKMSRRHLSMITSASLYYLIFQGW